MPNIIAIIGNDSRGHQVRLSDGEEVLVPYNAAHSLSIGEELEDPKAAHEITRLDQSQQPGHDEVLATRNLFPKFDIETGRLDIPGIPPTLDQLTSPGVALLDVEGHTVISNALDAKTDAVPAE